MNQYSFFFLMVWILGGCGLLFPERPKSNEFLSLHSEPGEDYQWSVKVDSVLTPETFTETIPFVGSKELGRLIVLEFTSQSWQEKIARPAVWKHRLSILEPESYLRNPEQHKTALLLVEGRVERTVVAPAIEQVSPYFFLAQLVNAPVVVLENVPNEPIDFLDDQLPPQHGEALMAETLSRFLTTGNLQNSLLYPMIRAVTRGMDAVQEFFCKQSAQMGQSVIMPEHFVLVGASKRGWTSWLVANRDRRVSGFVSIVADFLNLPEQMRLQAETYHHHASAAFSDYIHYRLVTKLLEDPKAEALSNEIDPLYHLNRIAHIPKLIVSAAGDEYTTVESVNAYWPMIPGHKDLLIEPNASHTQGNLQLLISSMAVFFDRTQQGLYLPSVGADLNGITINYQSELDHPVALHLWVADSPTGDFRKETIGANAWQGFSINLPTLPKKIGNIHLQIPLGGPGKPLRGQRAYFYEIVFSNQDPLLRKAPELLQLVKKKLGQDFSAGMHEYSLTTPIIVYQ